MLGYGGVLPKRSDLDTDLKGAGEIRERRMAIVARSRLQSLLKKVT